MSPERLLPAPLPPIEPRWEYLADAGLRAVYEDYKARLQVPWVGVVSMAYARHRAFFDCWWSGIRDVVDTSAYVETTRALRARVETEVAALDPPPIAPRLSAMGYGAREIDEIRDIIEFLSHGNFAQMPAVFLARHLIEGGSFGADAAATEKFAGRHGVACETPFVLIEPHHALPDLAAVYADVKARVGLPFVNTDYRALARWPSFFALAWSDLRLHVGGRAHEAMALGMHEAAFNAVGRLPNPAGLTAADLADAARRDGAFGTVRDLTRVFTHLIPGLVVNVAFLRRQLL